jgi:hypothetical protein
MPEDNYPQYPTATWMDRIADGMSMLENLHAATQSYLAGMSRYTTDFFIPYLLSTSYFQREEGKRLLAAEPQESFEAYLGLLDNNIELINRSINGTKRLMEAYSRLFLDDFGEALQESFLGQNDKKLVRFTERQAALLNAVAHVYPKAIEAIEPEFGFHFERGEHVLLDETDRFLLYRVAPLEKKTSNTIRCKADPDHPTVRTGSQHPIIFTGGRTKLRPLFRQPGISHIYSSAEGYRFLTGPAGHDRRRRCSRYPTFL